MNRARVDVGRGVGEDDFDDSAATTRTDAMATPLGIAAPGNGDVVAEPRALGGNAALSSR